ncbi:MAG: hypothetical protein ACK4IT_05635 [Thioalkalivibrionaceae bacterium]
MPIYLSAIPMHEVPESADSGDIGGDRFDEADKADCFMRLMTAQTGARML